MGWRWACIAQLDTVHGTACIVHSPLVCKRGLHCSTGHGAQSGLHCAFTVGVQEKQEDGLEKGLHWAIGHGARNGLHCAFTVGVQEK